MVRVVNEVVVVTVVVGEVSVRVLEASDRHSDFRRDGVDELDRVITRRQSVEFAVMRDGDVQYRGSQSRQILLMACLQLPHDQHSLFAH